ESDSKIELPTQIQFPTKDVEDKNAGEDSCTVSETPPQSLLNRLKDKWDGWRPLKSLFTPIYQLLFWGYPETPKTPPLDVKPSDAVKPDTDRGLIGLALSGGGVRSATFNLGLLQSLAKNKVLQYCDYLSTVSGGGYIGSCLSALLAKNPDASTTPQTFPLRDERDGKNERAEVNHLRATKNYLKSGGGLFNLDTWNMIGIMVSGIVLMSAIPVALLLMMVLFLFYWKTNTNLELFQIILPFIAILALMWMVGIRFRQVNSSLLLEKALTVIGFALTLILALLPFLILYSIMEIVSTPVLIIGLVISILILLWIINIYVGSIFSSNADSKYLQLNQRLARRALVVGLLVPFLLLIGFINHFADAWYQAKLTDYSSLSIIVIFTLAMVVGVGFIVYSQFKAQLFNILTAMVLIVLLVTSSSWLLAELLYLDRYDKAEIFINQIKNEQLATLVTDEKEKGWEKLRQSILLIGLEKVQFITRYMNGLMKDWDKLPKSDQGDQDFSLGELPSWNPYSLGQCLTGNALYLEELNQKVEAEKHWRKQMAKIPLTEQMEAKNIDFSAADLEKWFQSMVTIAYYHCSHLKLDALTQQMARNYHKNQGFFVDSYNQPSETVSQFLWFFVLVIVLLLLISLFTNINRNALHDFYRDRLSKTYLIRRRCQDEKAEDKEILPNPSVLMKDIHACCNGPYHLINTTLNIPSSEKPALQGRGADFFIFSKYYCGAESTGYQDTQQYEDGKTKLATAMAISGAAASPQMGSGGSLIMSFIMTLLNIRLNQWMPNPNRKRLPLFTIWPRYLSQEFLRQGTENEPLLNLSDGGHHENLGIYPLLKRRCKLIIASDAGADPNYQMADFANLQRKASIDLGVTIDMDMSPLYAKQTQNSEKNSKAYFVKGTITYANGQTGTLLYIKTTMTGHEPEQLLGYQRQHPTFPDETTADQFFNEAQFESYRKLGELIGEECCEVVDEKTGKKIGFDILAEIEQSLKPSSEKPKIGDVELKLLNKNAEQTLRYMENVIVRTDKPVTFYAGREGESSLGEQFCHLVQEIVNQDRSLLIETVREWLNRKTHQNLLWFASDIIGYFKLTELRDDLHPFYQTIMAEPDGYWVNWKLNCLWAYARFNDYREVHHLLQTTQNADTQKWLLAVYPQMVKAHHSKEDEHDEKYKDFMSEINRFLQCPGIQNDVKTEAQKVLDALKGFSKT
ncbi:MAG: patatin-like phospholipase family protein, partial [Candidatus Parabeggiatoa sp.]|nr:patatin-like phospholipase family protein [Candidatus Parabeggiatoa sp.]